MAKLTQKPLPRKKVAKEPVATADGAKPPRNKRKTKPGRGALRNIRKIQSANPPKELIPRASFARLVRELLAQSLLPDARITRSAIDALQIASEAATAQCLNVANALACDISKSPTLKLKHLRVARNIIFHPHKLSDGGITHGSLMSEVL